MEEHKYPSRPKDVVYVCTNLKAGASHAFVLSTRSSMNNSRNEKENVETMVRSTIECPRTVHNLQVHSVK